MGLRRIIGKALNKSDSVSSNAILLGSSMRHKIDIVNKPQALTFFSGRVSISNNKYTAPVVTVTYVGRNMPCYLDYINQPNHNVIILGSSGSGKSTTFRSFIARNYINNRLPFLVIDWNGENEDWAGESGITLWKVPKHMKINPFMLRGASPAERAGNVSELFQFGAQLTPLQANRIRGLLMDFYNKGNSAPKLFEIWEKSNSKGRYRGRSDGMAWLDQRLRMVQKVFGEEPEEFWDGIFTRNNIVSLSGLNEMEKRIVAYAILQRIKESFDRKPLQGKGPALLIGLDEAWQVLQSQRFGNNVYESLPSTLARQGRKYRFGIVVSTQQIEDLPRAFLNSSSLKIVHSYNVSGRFDSPHDVFGLGDNESKQLKSAKIGECFVFDQIKAQSGQIWPEYVKVRELTAGETSQLVALNRKHVPREIDEEEMPIDTYVSNANYDSVDAPVLNEDARPTPPMHAALLAIDNNRVTTLNVLARYIREKGWIKSDHTIYGDKQKPGVFAVLQDAGMAVLENGEYKLTDTGKRWVKYEGILADQANHLGSELHRQLLMATIDRLHKENMLVVSGEGKDAFDLIAYPVNPQKRFLWGRPVMYEIQTDAKPDSIRAVEAKKRKYRVNRIVYVSNNEKVLEELKKDKSGNEYILLKDI